MILVSAIIYLKIPKNQILNNCFVDEKNGGIALMVDGEPSCISFIIVCVCILCCSAECGVYDFSSVYNMVQDGVL